MRTKTIAIAGSIAALSFAAAPVAAVAASTHHGHESAAHVDRSRDIHGVKHAERTPDRHSQDKSRDARDR
jgi:Ni/Co efflux regulator RcnB